MTSTRSIAIVTGGAGGIGRAVVEQLAGRGHAVVIADIDDARGMSLERELSDRGHEVCFHHYDAADREAAEHVVASTRERFGGVNAGVSCAGVTRYQSSEHTTLDASYPDYLRFDSGDWAGVLDINLTAVYHFVQSCARAMIDGGRRGSLVVVTSIAAADPAFASNPAYGVSKAGLVAAIKYLAPRLAAHDIRINAVGPGTTETQMSSALRADEETLQRALRSVPMGRLAQPDEIAAAICFLADDRSSFITGESLYVDGGYFTG